MEKKKIKKANMWRWLDKIAENHELILPVLRNVVQFARTASPREAALDFTNSVLPPKNFFLPETEGLFAFSKEAGEWKLKTEPGPGRDRVIFGIRQCDLRSLRLLDCVFSPVDRPESSHSEMGGERGRPQDSTRPDSWREFSDSHFGERRRRTTLIGLACNEPGDTCFCRSFDIDPFSSDGTDIMLIDLGDEYLADVSTQRGADLLKRSRDLFSGGSERDEKKATELKASALDKIRIIPIDGVGERLGSLWEDPLWSDLAQKCIGCGVCTFLCPTCHCFDIQDEDRGRSGMRFRCWDSCLFPDFTLMASGENPRPTRRERIRQRFSHKFKYFPERYGAFACVGCGRCLSKCPVNLDITQILSSLATE